MCESTIRWKIEEDEIDATETTSTPTPMPTPMPTPTSLRISKDEGKANKVVVDNDIENGIVENVMKLERLLVGDNHGMFLKKLRERFDKVDVEIPSIEVRYEDLLVESDARVGNEVRPTLFNATKNFIQAILTKMLRPVMLKNKTHKILHNLSGIVKPSRMTLLLGPPSSGKTTLLLALAGMLENNGLQVKGKITYCGHELNEFVPKRTCAYITQYDLHLGAMTIRETLNFSRRCLGNGTKYELLKQLLEREKALGINPNQDVDSFMKDVATKGQDTSLVTNYLLKILGLDLCADTIVGDDMRRGISGGEKKRLTIGEILAGPAKVLLMDEISTGLDSSTAYQVCKNISDMVHIMNMTTIISLLQPTPELYQLFDDIILLSDGQIVYQGPCDQVLEFFEYVGFKCPIRKEVPDFLQEVTSKNDQQQYWYNDQQPYKFFSTQDFVQAFKSFKVGQNLASNLRVPYNKAKAHPLALAKEKYGISNVEMLRACFSREWLLMRHNVFIYIFKCVQVTIMGLVTMTAFYRTTMNHETILDGEKYIGALFFSLTNSVLNGMAETTLTIIGLPIFYKQRDFLFYPAWAYGLPVWILSIPWSFLESGLWTCITYYTIGYAPAASRFFCQWLAYFSIHQMALSIFRSVSAIGRTLVIANTIGMIILLFFFVLSGLIIAKGDIGPWMIWAYYISPMMYGEHALVINEFLDKRWSIPNADPKMNETTIGKAILASRDLFHYQYWFWISIGALLGFSFLYNLLYIVALTYLNPVKNIKRIVQDDDNKVQNNTLSMEQSVNKAKSTTMMLPVANKEMSLPFQRLSLTFSHINYYVDLPSGMTNMGYEGNRIQLLRDVSGAFKPGVLTALLGVTGAGKTTLMDVLAGKKTSGYIEGNITISGYPKNQDTFARVFGYCEQIDIHSPNITVYESLMYSAWLRLSVDVDGEKRKEFVEEILRLMELEPLRDVVIGLPRINGLSSEQRKRLTIAVELVANPSILFMDEPTTGLDARAAAIVVRTIRNTVNCGRTVVCTIHQPSIKMFEAFDELLLMKRGGQLIYAGPLGSQSQKLISYFEAIPGVPKIKDGCNPATWILDITNSHAESQLDFAQLYTNSELYRKNQEINEELSVPLPNSKDLQFSAHYSQPFNIQFKACFWKQNRSYWQNPSYSAIRFLMTVLIGVILGVISWNKGCKTTTQQDLINLFGMMFSAILFLGGVNALNVQALIASERTIFYREKAARMYSALPFALALLAIEAIHLMIINFAYCILLYSMIGFEWSIGKFFYFYYFILMCMTYSTTFGMMLISLTPRAEISAIFMTFFVTLWHLFAGFFLPRPQIPKWWRWFYWASPVAWTMYGLLTSQVGDKSSLVEVPEVASMPLKFFLKETLGYDYDFLPYVVVAHIGWVFLFSFIFVLGIKFLNFQKR